SSESRMVSATSEPTRLDSISAAGASAQASSVRNAAISRRCTPSLFIAASLSRPSRSRQHSLQRCHIRRLRRGLSFRRVHEHILKQFDRDLQTLKDRILLMAGMVEQHIAESTRALSAQDLPAAQRLARADRPVNLLEMECDELCVRMIAQWQPAASDLRFLIAALKITTD